MQQSGFDTRYTNEDASEKELAGIEIYTNQVFTVCMTLNESHTLL